LKKRDPEELKTHFELGLKIEEGTWIQRDDF